MNTAFLQNITSRLYRNQAFLKIEKTQKMMIIGYNDDLKLKIQDLTICEF